MKIVEKGLVAAATILLSAILLWWLITIILHGILAIVVPLFILFLILYVLKKILW